MCKDKKVSMLGDILLRLEECKKYEMKYAELSINDCIALLNIIKRDIELEVYCNGTATI